MSGFGEIPTTTTTTNKILNADNKSLVNSQRTNTIQLQQQLQLIQLIKLN